MTSWLGPQGHMRMKWTMKALSTAFQVCHFHARLTSIWLCKRSLISSYGRSNTVCLLSFVTVGGSKQLLVHCLSPASSREQCHMYLATPSHLSALMLTPTSENRMCPRHSGTPALQSPLKTLATSSVKTCIRPVRFRLRSLRRLPARCVHHHPQLH